MLLGTANTDTSPSTELLLNQLLTQRRYAEAFELLMKQKSNNNSSLYNMALCLLKQMII